MAGTDQLERWWSKDTVAVVTGSNTRIGLATARQLARHGLSVVLTARDHAKGTAAMEVLKGEGLESSYFHPLDVTSSKSVADLAVWLKAQFGGFDIPIRKIKVNNAGVNSFSSTDDDGVTMLETDYYGVKKVTSGLQHLYRYESLAGARIVNVSFTTGLLQHLQSAQLKKTLADVQHLTEELADSFAARYVQDLKKSKLISSEEWPWAVSLQSYREFKAFLNVYSRVLSRRLEKERCTDCSVSVNCTCPGFTNTNLRRGRMKWVQDQGVDVSKEKASGPRGRHCCMAYPAAQGRVP